MLLFNRIEIASYIALETSKLCTRIYIIIAALLTSLQGTLGWPMSSKFMHAEIYRLCLLDVCYDLYTYMQALICWVPALQNHNFILIQFITAY